ncbi:MAG: CBS domain-containing protein [Candidatus Omnitrophica bacterium]|nr:CBS domain-containing protein [Candidatus Omnitrophota bacterium]
MAQSVVKQYMSSHPYWIKDQATVQEAIDLVLEKKIRHLPVKKGEQVIGIITDRDLRFLFGMRGTPLGAQRVASFCDQHPYTVAPDTLLSEAAQAMVEHRHEAAIVMEGGKMVGIFTTMDACRALADLAKG